MFLQSEILTTQYFIPIIILLGIASITSILISVFKLKFLPTFAIEIVIGMIIARWFNGYMESIHMETFVAGLYTLGLVMIMFLSGYDVDFDVDVQYNFNKPKQKVIHVFKSVIIITLLIYLCSIFASFFFTGYMTSQKIFGIILLTIAFSSTFAGLVVPIIHDEGLHHTIIGKILATLANLTEALAIIFLTIFMIYLDVEREYAIILFSIGIFLIVFRLFKKVKLGKLLAKVTEGIDHLPTRIAFVILLIFVFLSNMSGGEYILGAFLAGIFVRYSGFSENIMTSLSRIIYGVFAPMFFILVGTGIDIYKFFENPHLLLTVFYIFITMLLVRIPILYLFKCYNLNTIIPSIVLTSCTIIVSIAIQHINDRHDSQIFSHEFVESLIFASLLICVMGTLVFKIRFPFGQYNQRTRGHLEESNDDYCVL